jgi:hypothetical protein
LASAISPVAKHNPAVVSNILMHNRHSNIDQHIFTHWTDQQLKKHFPAMKKCVALIEMVLTAVPTVTATKYSRLIHSFPEMLPPSSEQNE